MSKASCVRRDDFFMDNYQQKTVRVEKEENIRIRAKI